jgi:hypothetical protein
MLSYANVNVIASPTEELSCGLKAVHTTGCFFNKSCR